jgi:hypothetical protein
MEPMLFLTTTLLILSGIALGLARRSWWEITVLFLLLGGVLHLGDAWVGGWRDQVGLSHEQRVFDLRSIGWLLLGVYASYGLAFLYSRWRLPAGRQSNH